MISKKVVAGIAVIKYVKPFVPKDRYLYNATVQPYFNNCCPLWDSYGKVKKNLTIIPMSCCQNNRDFKINNATISTTQFEYQLENKR